MSVNIPETLKYTDDHEWAKIEGEVATIGISDYAQNALGDIVFVELPEVGRELSKGDSFGVVESIKSVSDLYSPFSGEVIETNSALEESSDLCNSDPYGSWMIKIKLSNPSEADSLLSSEKYSDHCKNL